MGMTGANKDQMQIDLCGTNVDGAAANWFHTKVEAWNRTQQQWTFIDLIIAFYKWFIHEVTTQNANTKYHNTQYSKAKGDFAFYNELEHHAYGTITR